MRSRPITLTDTLLAVGLLGLAAVFVGPYLGVRSILRAEDRVAERVAELGRRMVVARDNGGRDSDGDGIAEFPFLDALVANDPFYEPTDIPGIYRYDGYYYAALLPNAQRTAVLPEDDDVSADLAEIAFAVVAWPVQYGDGGMRAYAFRQADGLLLHAIDGFPYGRRPPTLDGVWIERRDGAWVERPYRATHSERNRAWVSPRRDL